MIILRRLLPIAAALGLFGVLELIYAQQSLFWFLVPLVAFLTLFPVSFLMRWRFESGIFWQLLVTPSLLIGSCFFLLLFLSDRVLSHALMLLSCGLFAWYTENVFLFHYHTDEYQPYALEHISLYINLLSVFFFFSSLYAARIFLSVPIIFLIVGGTLVSVLFALQIVLGSKISWKRGSLLMFGVTLIMLELFLSISILPTTFFVAGLLMAIPYYLMMNLIRHAFRDALSMKVILRNGIIGAVSFALTLLVAPWT